MSAGDSNKREDGERPSASLVEAQVHPGAAPKSGTAEVPSWLTGSVPLRDEGRKVGDLSADWFGTPRLNSGRKEADTDTGKPADLVDASPQEIQPPLLERLRQFVGRSKGGSDGNAEAPATGAGPAFVPPASDAPSNGTLSAAVVPAQRRARWSVPQAGTVGEERSSASVLDAGDTVPPRDGRSQHTVAKPTPVAKPDTVAKPDPLVKDDSGPRVFHPSGGAGGEIAEARDSAIDHDASRTWRTFIVWALICAALYLGLGWGWSAREWAGAQLQMSASAPREACTEGRRVQIDLTGWALKPLRPLVWSAERARAVAVPCAQADAAEVVGAIVPRIQALAFASARCGDGRKNGSEGCDDGNTLTETCAYGGPACEVCDAECHIASGRVPICGDSVVDAPQEQCDLGTVPSVNCSSRCTLPSIHCFGTSGPVLLPDGGAIVASDISIVGEIACATQPEGPTVCWSLGTEVAPTQLPDSAAGFRRIRAGGSNFCGVNEKGEVSCFVVKPGQTDATSSELGLTSGPIDSFALSATSICGTGPEGVIECRGGLSSCPAPPNAVALAGISVALDTVCGFNRETGVVCWKCEAETTVEIAVPSSEFQKWKLGPAFWIGLRKNGALRVFGVRLGWANSPELKEGRFRATALTGESLCLVSNEGIPSCFGAAATFPGVSEFNARSEWVSLSDNGVCFFSTPR